MDYGYILLSETTIKQKSSRWIPLCLILAFVRPPQNAQLLRTEDNTVPLGEERYCGALIGLALNESQFQLFFH